MMRILLWHVFTIPLFVDLAIPLLHRRFLRHLQCGFCQYDIPNLNFSATSHKFFTKLRTSRSFISHQNCVSPDCSFLQYSHCHHRFTSLLGVGTVLSSRILGFRLWLFFFRSSITLIFTTDCNTKSLSSTVRHISCHALSLLWSFQQFLTNGNCSWRFDFRPLHTSSYSWNDCIDTILDQILQELEMIVFGAAFQYLKFYSLGMYTLQSPTAAQIRGQFHNPLVVPSITLTVRVSSRRSVHILDTIALLHSCFPFLSFVTRT